MPAGLGGGLSAFVWCDYSSARFHYLLVTLLLPGTRHSGLALVTRYTCGQRTSCADHQGRQLLSLVDTLISIPYCLYTYNVCICSTPTSIAHGNDGSVPILMLSCNARCSVYRRHRFRLSRKQRTTLGMKLLTVSTTWPEVTILWSLSLKISLSST